MLVRVFLVGVAGCRLRMLIMPILSLVVLLTVVRMGRSSEASGRGMMSPLRSFRPGS